MPAQPFRIHVEDRVLDDLRARLEEARWASLGEPRAGTDRGEEGDWSRGTAPTFLRELIAYWRTGYDWRVHEASLNRLPQFTAIVRRAPVHFVHVKGRGPRATPLLLLHGWPDSFYRYHKVIPVFANQDGVGGPFDVIVPSLPGFAFTGPVEFPITQPTRYSAQLLWELMTRVLGYSRFAVAGGDGGSALAQILAIDHPENVIGVHLTDLGWHVGSVDPSKLSKHEQRYLERSKKAFMADGAYALVQATRPRSLAVALHDSPVGLASWIVDRFHSWSDSKGPLEDSFSKDELLTNIMIYWATQTIGSSMFTYYADWRSPSLSPSDFVDRPVGLALFPEDVGGIPPRSFAERTLNVNRWTEMPRGGHFAALEEPELYATDVQTFFGSLGSRDLQGTHDVQRESRHDGPSL